MEQIVKIYFILQKLRLVDSKEDFSTVFCKRHKKWLKDGLYHRFTPNIPVLLNIRGMISRLLKASRSDDQLHDYVLEMQDGLQECLALITQAMEKYHADIITKLNEAITEEFSQKIY
ncbi:hypothetical protein [Methylophaga sp.]|uniref:hypothetical protein n=1 Tax=Methylophaga sp. TaxID=2024840 RepID=UPI003F6F33C8